MQGIFGKHWDGVIFYSLLVLETKLFLFSLSWPFYHMKLYRAYLQQQHFRCQSLQFLYFIALNKNDTQSLDIRKGGLSNRHNIKYLFAS
jgi:hypothetical protein